MTRPAMPRWARPAAAALAFACVVGALIAAEIDRIERAAMQEGADNG